MISVVYRRIAQVTDNSDEAIECVGKALEIKEEPTTLFLRFQINMSLENQEEALKDANRIMELDSNFLNGAFKTKWLPMATKKKLKKRQMLNQRL